MKVAISIPDSVFEAAERLARRLGKSRSQLYSEAVAEFLEEHRAEAVTEKLNAVYESESSRLADGFDAAQLHSLRDEAW